MRKHQTAYALIEQQEGDDRYGTYHVFVGKGVTDGTPKYKVTIDWNEGIDCHCNDSGTDSTYVPSSWTYGDKKPHGETPKVVQNLANQIIKQVQREWAKAKEESSSKPLAEKINESISSHNRYYDVKDVLIDISIEDPENDRLNEVIQKAISCLENDPFEDFRAYIDEGEFFFDLANEDKSGIILRLVVAAVDANFNQKFSESFVDEAMNLATAYMESNPDYGNCLLDIILDLSTNDGDVDACQAAARWMCRVDELKDLDRAFDVYMKAVAKCKDYQDLLFLKNDIDNYFVQYTDEGERVEGRAPELYKALDALEAKLDEEQG